MDNQNTTIAIIGATGATGKFVLQNALHRNFNIKVLARTPKKLDKFKDKIEIVKGSVSDLDTVIKLVEGCDVVLSTLGTSKKPNYIVVKGVEVILKAIQSFNSKPRFIHMSAVGLGDSLIQCRNSWLWTFIVKVTFPLIGSELFADMERAEKLISQAKDVKSVIMRAAVLNNKPARGYIVRSSNEPAGKMFISREDIANFMLDSVLDTSFDGKAVSLFSS